MQNDLAKKLNSSILFDLRKMAGMFSQINFTVASVEDGIITVIIRTNRTEIDRGQVIKNFRQMIEKRLAGVGLFVKLF